MLKIRLRRMGSKHDACYRIVVSDGRSTPGGRFVDVLGTYDPASSPGTIRLDVEKADAWIGKGARPSETVRTLISRARRQVAATPAVAPPADA